MTQSNLALATDRVFEKQHTLFEPIRVGAFRLANRIAMAPLTRNRAGPGLVPGPLAVEYYAQRASAGLIIAEATQISAQAQGYAHTPGCYTDDQVRGWRKVTDAVHAKGGTIVVQLWHTGRMSHTSFQKDGQAPVAPSAIRANAKTFVSGEGFIDVSMPRALRLDEIPGIIADFRHAARCAIDAGFDGVELHGAHGYLLDAFLRDGTNHRTDAYGGSIENRARLLFDVTKACALAIGVDRLGVRISPVSTAGDSHDSDPQALFDHVVDGLSRFRLAYVHVVEGETGGARDSIAFDYAGLRRRFEGVWMANNGYTREMAMDEIASGRADLVSFGRAFIANPDLVARLRKDAPLNELIGKETLYGGGAHGYTDYLFLDH
ncbi:alkene reductase [Methylobacterium sp. BTF04]|uniref:alkene reductase n=1 Tax=Methylobacterium sp. BTF04 TaxID=2708300 RepID=UPI0013D18BA4|nr:alkene reductase [Methylobacterium sp. BTF04]NEU14681.1 alkene reductase [Methylobacterium sp. BTF04]